MNRRRLIFCCAVFLLSSLNFLAAQEFDGIRLSVGDWNLGTIPDNMKKTMQLEMVNESGKTKRVSILPSCPCLKSERSTAELQPGEKLSLSIIFDPAGKPGPVNLFLVFLTDDPDSKGFLLPVHGTVSKYVE